MKNHVSDWKGVRRLHEEWKTLELDASDCDYDAIAANGAYKDFMQAKKAYEERYGAPWCYSDILIEVRGGVVQDVHNVEHGRAYVVVDYDNMEESYAKG